MAKDRSKNPDEQGGGEEYLNKEETKRVEIEQKKASILMELKEAQDGLVSRKAELFLRGKGAEEMANSFGKLLNEVEFLQTDITNLDLSLKASAVEKKLKVIKKQVSRWSDKVVQAFADYDELMKDLASSEVPPPEVETPDVEPKASPDISYGSGFLNFNKTILNFNPLLEKDTCDIFFENGVVMLAGKGKFANLFAEVNLGDDKKSLRVKIMRGPEVEYEQPAESAVSAKMILENYFIKKPDTPNAAATKKSTIVLPEADEPPAVDEADEKKAILSHAKTVLASPEEEPASKEIAGKFVLEDNIAKIGDVAIDLRPLVDSKNYEVSINEKGTVDIFDLNDENHRARFRFDKDEKKIAFQKMVKGHKSATVMLTGEAILPQLQYLFPELRPVVRPPFKFEGGVLTAEDFSWDLNSLLDREKCDVSLADNVVTFQGKGELSKIKIQMKIDKNNGEVRLKKGDDVKQFKVENAKNYLERTFAKEEKKVEVKKSEPEKVEPVAEPIENVEKGNEGPTNFLAGIISEEKLKKLKDILDKAVIEQNKFAKMATTAAIGLPLAEVGSKDYERKKKELKDKPEEFEKYEKSLEEIEIKRGVFTKEEYADFIKDVEKTLVDTYWRWHGMPRHEKDKTREKQDKWFNAVKEYLNIKPPEEQKFGDEAMGIYRELRGAFEDEFKSIGKSKAELFEIKIAKPELYNSYLSKIDALNEKTYSISEELESIEGDESLKEKEEYYRKQIEECQKELRSIMVDFDHERMPTEAGSSETITEREQIAEALKKRMPEIKAIMDKYDSFATSVKATLPDYYRWEMIAPTELENMIYDRLDEIETETMTAEEVNRRVDELLKHHRDFMNDLIPKVQAEYVRKNTEKEKMEKAKLDILKDFSHNFVRLSRRYRAARNSLLNSLGADVSDDFMDWDFESDKNVPKDIASKVDGDLNLSSDIDEQACAEIGASATVDEAKEIAARKLVEVDNFFNKSLEEFKNMVAAVAPSKAASVTEPTAIDIDTSELETPVAIDIDTSELETPATTPTPESTPPAKKSIWQRTKEKLGLAKESVFNKTAGKAAAEMAYKTAASIFGVKTITDIIGLGIGATGRGLAKKEIGFGDINKMYTSYREKKGEKSAIRTSMEEVFKGGEDVDKKIEDLRSKIENSKHISAKDRKALLENLQRIASEYESAENKATEERDKKVSALLKIYMKNKVSAMTLTKDALNTALTLSGMAFARGAAYAALSVGERMAKANAEFEKSKVGLAPNVRRSRTKFLLKDLTVGAAVETGRSLVFMGAKKETKGAGRVVDFVKAVGTLARGFGIYGLALTDSMNPEEAMQAFIEKVQEQGINCTVKDNFINNAERVIQLYTHPIDTISGQSAEQDPTAKGVPHGAEATSAVAAVPVAEQISPELKSYLDQFGDSPSAREAFLAEVNNGHSPEEVADAFVVHKGDGLERIIQRQLLLDPEKYGMHDQNILHDAGKLRQWAGHEASVIAVKNHLDDKYLIFNAKHPQHLVVNADGKIDLSGAGKLHHQSEIDAVRARGVVAEERAPERPVPAYEESGEEKFMTDVEKAQVDELWDSGRQADAMNMMMQYRELGPVYVLPSGFETHDHFGDLAGEAAGRQTAVVPRESAEQLAQELKTPEILGEKTVGESMAPISAPDSATDTKLQQMLETAEKHAGDEPPVVFHGDYGKPEFEYDKTGKVVGVDVNPDPNLTFGKAGKEVLSDRAGIISTSGAAKKVIELGAADDEYKELMNKGSQNTDEANFLKGVVAKKMTDLSKNTSKPLGQLFKSDVLYRYDFKAEAGLAAQLETADKYKG